MSSFNRSAGGRPLPGSAAPAQFQHHGSVGRRLSGSRLRVVYDEDEDAGREQRPHGAEDCGAGLVIKAFGGFVSW